VAQDLNVGLVGYIFMGKAHSHAYLDVAKFFPDIKARPVMKAICGRNKEGVSAMAEQWGWESYETSWEALVKRDDIDMIDITAPSYVHGDIAIAAAENGKHILCEKPLASTTAEAKKMLEAARKAGVKHMVGFNYRRVPAIAFAKQLIASGALGKIRHFRGTYLQDWISDPNFPMNWRLRKETAGSGAHGDLNAHLIDTARFLVGEITEVVGWSNTFIKERPREASAGGLQAVAGEGTETVTVDDATVFLAKFAGSDRVEDGAYATFEATRLAPGHKNYNRWEINGSEGTISFCFERMNELEYYNRQDPATTAGFRTIMVTEGDHPYIAGWWPPGHVIGYEHTFVHEVYDFVNAIADNGPVHPDFLDGARCVAVLEAADQSIESRGWAKVERID
jgi:predicted dehydrogenase